MVRHMQGMLRCAKYAFAPNKLKFCGPDKNKELAGYLKNKTSDWGLKRLLKDFEAMQPYLKLIAEANGIADEFDDRVVEAYWLGNELLEAVSLRKFYEHMNKRMSNKELRWFSWKLGKGVKPNHNCHVLNSVAKQRVETTDSCRIAWGRIIKPGWVKTDRLVYEDSQLQLKPAEKKLLGWEKNIRVNDLVSFHWGWVCEKINQKQRKNLQKYTDLAISLANRVI